MDKWLLAAFVALGGGALLWSLGKKYIPKAVDAFVEWLLKIPRVHDFVKANADAIIEILVTSGHLVRTDIEQVRDEKQTPESFSTNP